MTKETICEIKITKETDGSSTRYAMYIDGEECGRYRIVSEAEGDIVQWLTEVGIGENIVASET